MKVALLTHFYPPEACAAATRAGSLADALSRAGHEITVVTGFASFPQGNFDPSDRFTLLRREGTGRVRVVRLASLLLDMPGRRLIHWASASLAAAAYVLCTASRYDVVIATVPPITLAFPALAAARRHRAKLVVDVRDVFPDIAIAMGEWRAGGMPARLTERIVRALYRRADLVVAVTPTALTQIASRGIPAGRLFLAPNGAEERSAREDAPGNGKPFTAVYAGNLGLATDVDVLLDAAALLREEPVALEIVGGGALESYVRERVAREGLANVRLSGTLPREQAMQRIAASDIAVVPLRAGIAESVPTKIYDALSVGCPVIVAAGGEAEREGRALGSVCTPAGDASALASEISRLSRAPRSDVAEMGRRGRLALQERLGRAAIMDGVAARVASL